MTIRIENEKQSFTGDVEIGIMRALDARDLGSSPSPLTKFIHNSLLMQLSKLNATTLGGFLKFANRKKFESIEEFSLVRRAAEDILAQVKDYIAAEEVYYTEQDKILSPFKELSAQLQEDKTLSTVTRNKEQKKINDDYEKAFNKNLKKKEVAMKELGKEMIKLDLIANKKDAVKKYFLKNAHEDVVDSQGKSVPFSEDNLLEILDVLKTS